MNLLGNKVISSALFATAASVAIAAPAQAFDFVGGSFSFVEETTVHFTFEGGDGDFVDASVLDFGIADGSNAILETLFSGLTPADAPTTASYTFLAGLDYDLFLSRSDDALSNGAFVFFGDDADHVQYTGDLSSGLTIAWEDLIDDKDPSKIFRDGDFNDYIVSATVPTPAAVLPVMTGLLGFASKRKKSEEA